MKGDKIYKYCILDLDYDGTYYYKMRSIVKPFFKQNNDLSKLFKDFNDSLEKGLYIIGNYLFFTYDDVLYYISPSCFDTEYEFIGDLIKKIRSYGCTDIVYLFGRLD